MAQRGVSILGATGSIGQSTLSVIRQHPDQFKVVAISAKQSVDTLFQQCCEFLPQYAVMLDAAAANQLKLKLDASGLGQIKVLSGESGLCEISTLPEIEIVVAAIVGAAGLLSTFNAVEAGKTILLANKETLVMAGDFLLEKAKTTGALFLPVDSEHNALFQCMPAQYVTGSRPEGVRKIILTASGGMFLNHPSALMVDITPEQACCHPNWKMGPKITVDCSTMMNKGLEVIEACRLFRLAPHEIETIVHPQSIIHSLVEYHDGSFLAQLGVPDMRVPIAQCLAWPKRIESGAKSLSLIEIGQLSFQRPDLQKFPCLRLAYESLTENEAAPIVLNASNEVAVAAFLAGELRFTDIPVIVEKALNSRYSRDCASLDAILDIDAQARRYSQKLIDEREILIAS